MAQRVSDNNDHMRFVEEMMANWNYSEKEARTLREDRQSWMAVPIIGNNNTVIAVVFLDSNQRTLFKVPIQRIVINGCSGIASFIRKRYN